MPDEMYLKWQFRHIYHKKLNIKHPVTYADKLAYMKVKIRDARLSKLVDKAEVRTYVAEVIGDQYLIPLIGIYDAVSDIPWDDLPQEYVLKCTHDSASVILHVNGMEFNKNEAIESLSKHLKRNMYWYSREYPYKNIKPRIICERFLNDHGKPPVDYKIMCFDGKAHYIVVDIDRFGNHRRDVYDTNWVKQDITTDHPQGVGSVPEPGNLHEMLYLAEKLAKGFTHVRVDFYSVNGKIFFG